MTCMLKNDTVNKNNFLVAKGILRKFMADYSSTDGVPSGGGYYAAVSRSTGQVWFSDTKSFTGTKNRFCCGGLIPKLLRASLTPNQKPAMFYTTNTKLEVDKLKEQLQKAGLLLNRSKKETGGQVKVYLITHRSGYYYLAKTRRKDIHEFESMSRFISTLQKRPDTLHPNRNINITNFITNQVEDILNGTGFEVSILGEYKDVSAAVEACENYYINQQHLKCLNDGFRKR